VDGFGFWIRTDTPPSYSIVKLISSTLLSLLSRISHSLILSFRLDSFTLFVLVVNIVGNR
jgi:hypothetical protein